MRIRALAAAAGIALFSVSLPVNATVLWKHPGEVLVHNNGPGEDILLGAIKPQDTNSSSTLFFRFRIEPSVDSAAKSISDFEAGFVFVLKGEERLGFGSTHGAWAYCAMNVPKSEKGYVDLRSATPDPPFTWEYIRAGVPRYIAFKVEFVPGQDARITAWLNPDLSLGSSEVNQPTNIVTHFEADANFDAIHLIHRGHYGGGWQFSEMVAGTTFEDLRLEHFWQQGWFIIASGGSLLAMAVGMVQFFERRRAARRIRQLENERVLASERARIARDIHDEVGTSLTKISKLTEMMERPDRTGNPQDFTRNIAETARYAIQAMDEIVWAINPKNDTLKEMADYLVYFTEDFLRPAGINCALEVPLDLPDIPVPAEVRHNLFMAVKEALNNAVKHGAARQVELALSFVNNQLTIRIADNGKGFRPEHLAPPGNGLDNIRKRVNAIGGKLDFQSEPGAGTAVILKVLLEPAPVVA